MEIIETKDLIKISESPTYVEDLLPEVSSHPMVGISSGGMVQGRRCKGIEDVGEDE